MNTYAASAAIRTLVAAILLCSTVVAANAADYNLRAVADSKENDEDHDGLIVLKDFVESRSNGAIAVELIVGTQECANGTECLQALQDGTIDITRTTSGGAANAYPYVQVLDLPYILSDDRVAEQVTSGNFTRELRTRILADSDNAIRLMTIGNTGGWRHFANTRRTVRTPEDMAGLKIRTVLADLPRELVTSLGASPTPIPWPELFTSLQTGRVDGSRIAFTDIMSMRFPEAGLKYATLDGHAYLGALWFMNNKTFMDMPEPLRRVMVDAFDALQQATFASAKRRSVQARADFVKAGGELYAPSAEEMAAFRTAAEPVHRWFVDSVEGGGQWLELLVNEADRAREANEAAYVMDVN